MRLSLHRFPRPGLLAAGLLSWGCAQPPIPDDWVLRAQIVSAWPLPEAQRARFEVDVNGVWLGRTPEEIEAEHRGGRPALVSVQGLAGEAWLLDEHPELVDAISRDVFGNPSRVPWYDWLEEPVATLSIVHPAFRDFLVARGTEAVDAGADGLFVDEIQTSALLISLEEFGAGFAPVEVEAFLLEAGHASFSGYAAAELGLAWDSDLPAFLRGSDPTFEASRDQLYTRYRRFQEEAAFRAMSGVIADVRAHAVAQGETIAVGANLAGLGALTEWSPLTAPIWQESMDFVVFEHDPPSLSSAFAPYYQLGRATLPGLVAAMPGLTLSDTLNAGGGHAGWLQMAYAEAFAFEGNWAVSYWTEEMGWDADALLPDALRASMQFVDQRRELFEGERAPHRVGLRYPNAAVLDDPAVHEAWVETAEALLAAHVPFDVLYSGDPRFVATEPDASGYSLVLDPGDAVPVEPPGQIGAPDGIFATSYSRVGQPGPLVHLVNRSYDEASDAITALGEFPISLRVGPGADEGEATFFAPASEPRTVRWQVADGVLRLVVPRLEFWSVVVIER